MFVPMNESHWIEPGTETPVQMIDAIRALALSAQAAELEYDAISEGKLEDQIDLAANSSDVDSDAESAADRAYHAADALTLEVEALERLGLGAILSDLAEAL